MFEVTKHYGHELGLSCCFRQPGADSHCRFLHGYALAFSFTFAAQRLNGNNWVVDFGAMKPIKEWLQQNFDHTLVVAEKDPQRELLEELAKAGVADVRIFPKVGCEAFAELAAIRARKWIVDIHEQHRLTLQGVTVAEHPANSATWSPF